MTAPKGFPGERNDVAFKISRLAHWLLNDGQYTKRNAALELAEIARRLSPELASLTLGDAANLVPDDTARLRHIADEPEIFRFLYDMLGEVYVHNTTGKVREGLTKDGVDRLDAIRQLIDDDLDDKKNGKNAYADSAERAQ